LRILSNQNFSNKVLFFFDRRVQVGLPLLWTTLCEAKLMSSVQSKQEIITGKSFFLSKLFGYFEGILTTPYYEVKAPHKKTRPSLPTDGKLCCLFYKIVYLFGL
jgi:hypothetical protein